MSRIHALVLAGGKGSRLGDVHKAELRLGGVRLIERVAARLGQAQRPLLIANGHGPAISLEQSLCLADAAGDQAGPISGIVAGIRHLENYDAGDVLVTVAVDTPFLPVDYVERLVAALDGGAKAARAWFGPALYPTNAAYRLGALAGLQAQVAAGVAPHSPKALQTMLGATEVDWSGMTDADPFANLNTLEDLIKLGHRAACDN